jgi:glycosyltransferase involved in cell wall biosynthesis
MLLGPRNEPGAPQGIVCFAGDSWSGNPHSRHHLMKRFAAAGWWVLFVEGVPMRGVVAGDPHEWGRIRRKLRSPAGLRTPLPRLHTLQPMPIPPTGPLGRRMQVGGLWLQINAAKRRLGLRGSCISWFSLPVAAPLRGHLSDSASIFYYQDRYEEFMHVDAPYLRAGVARLAAECDISIASAQELADDLVGLGAQPIVVPHGVDTEFFAAPAPIPEDLAGLERPLVGCVGLIDDHMDLSAIGAIAESLDHGTVVLVGASNISSAHLEHHRIRLLGPRPYETMPGYLQAFDVCLVPFARTRLTAAVNPIKLREYLAAGRPTVATPLPEIVPYRDVVELVEDDDWPAALKRALAPGADTEAHRAARRARVRAESWDVAAERVAALLRRLPVAR